MLKETVVRVHRLKSLMRQWRVEAGLVYKIPADWPGKLRLVTDLRVPTSGLPYSGSNENILLARNGVELDRRLREELERRRGVKLWMKLLLRGLRFYFAPTPAW